MNCAQLQKEMLLKGVDDAAVSAHLVECADCRRSVDVMELFVSAKIDSESYKIPKRVDDYVTSESRAFIDVQQRPQVVSEPVHYVNPFYKLASVFAYAACFFLVAWMVITVLADLNGTPVHKIYDKGTLKSSLLNQEIKKWDNVDMGDDLFVLNTEIEINFAYLSFSDEKEEDSLEYQDEFYIEIPDLDSI